jgi:uncharacterized Fe-S cluster-containing radical SAM superfamily protein
MEPLCHIPWSWLEIDLDKKNIRNCCKTKWYTDDDFKLFQHDEILKRRVDFLNGIKSDDCLHCWKLEELGQPSYRQFTKNSPYLKTDNFNIDTSVPSTLSINLGSLCNIACSYCNEEYSTVWAAEKKIPIKLDLVNHFELKILNWLESIILNNKLKHLILIGGEPTINPSFYKILELLKSIGPNRSNPLKVTIQTNGMFSIRQRNSIIEYSNIPNCHFTYRFSIDAVGARAEFIRNGLDWECFKNNFEALMAGSARVTIHPTLSIYSLGGLKDLLDWVESYDYEWEDFGSNHLEGPHEMSLRSLGNLSQELIPNLPIYKNKKIQEYSVRTTRFIKSFKEEPDIKDIIRGIGYHSSRSKIPKEDAIPDLLNLLDKYSI